MRLAYVGHDSYMLCAVRWYLATRFDRVAVQRLTTGFLGSAFDPNCALFPVYLSCAMCIHIYLVIRSGREDLLVSESPIAGCYIGAF